MQVRATACHIAGLAALLIVAYPTSPVQAYDGFQARPASTCVQQTGTVDLWYYRYQKQRGEDLWLDKNAPKARYYQTLSESNSRLACVRTLQSLLNRAAAKDHRILVDGIFGPETRAAVVQYQQYWADLDVTAEGQAIAVDGVVGPAPRGHCCAMP
jgi:hypothetical protein